jgi:hypothetical protein
MIHLYIKTHNKTGLKYFGKTSLKNAHSYRGSGKYWLRHLKVHGNDVSTEVVASFDEKNIDSLREFAIDFSIKNNIVESKEWANLVIETGTDGTSMKGEDHPMWGKFGKDHQRYGKPLSDESRAKMSKAQKGRIITKEARQKISKKLKGQVIPEEVKEKISRSMLGKNRGDLNGNKGKTWWTNGVDNIMAFECPKGYFKGRTISKSK